VIVFVNTAMAANALFARSVTETSSRRRGMWGRWRWSWMAEDLDADILQDGFES
jgi:hypothetical protein